MKAGDRLHLFYNEIAWAGHILTHLSHPSRHLSGWETFGLELNNPNLKTSWSHTLRHLAQPTHLSRSNFGYAPVITSVSHRTVIIVPFIVNIA